MNASSVGSGNENSVSSLVIMGLIGPVPITLTVAVPLREQLADDNYDLDDAMPS